MCLYMIMKSYASNSYCVQSMEREWNPYLQTRFSPVHLDTTTRFQRCLLKLYAAFLFVFSNPGAFRIDLAELAMMTSLPSKSLCLLKLWFPSHTFLFQLHSSDIALAIIECTEGWVGHLALGWTKISLVHNICLGTYVPYHFWSCTSYHCPTVSLLYSLMFRR